MFKRLLSLSLLVALFSVQANAAADGQLKSLFDDLNYSLSVDWDQTDKEFYKAEMKKFNAEIENLQSNGLTNAELVQFAKTQVKDTQMLAELDAAFNLIALGALSKKEAKKVVFDAVNKSYATGASWQGSAGIVAAAVIVLILAVALAGGTTTVSSGGGGGLYCYDEYVCYDYYDSWGYYWYSDCYYETYCY